MPRACKLASILWLVPAVLAADTSRGVSFAEVAADSGIGWRNLSGGSPEKWTILETTGAGACLFDAEGDGDLDLYLVSGGTLKGLEGVADPAARDAFYLNDGQGRFRDATAAAGFEDRGWGGGCSAADVDNDGDSDLYVTHFRADVFYRNDGQGRFRDETAAAGFAPGGKAEDRWSLGAAFFDAEGDGDLDLYVANYLRFDPADPAMLARRCRWKSGDVMCGPRGFTGEADVFYRNRGDGTFAVASEEAGVGGDALYGMGVVAGDLDGDGDRDLFVADDSQQNLLLVNDGRGRFRDAALEAGVSLSGDGRPQAGMGADLGDYDGDGDQDLLVTNFSDDYHTLYRNEGDLLFTDVSAAAGLDPATRASVGWGGGFFDFDNDGDLGIFIASGHVYPGVENFDPATTFRQRNLLFENDGRGVFREVGPEAGAALAATGHGRGVAFGDLDNDGDLDLVVVNSDEAPSLLRNEGGSRRHSVQIRLVGSKSPRDGTGAQLRLWSGGRSQVREARRGGGYLSSSDPRIHFGLGDAEKVEKLELRWPSGREQVLENLPADCVLTIDEERGLVAKNCRDVAALPAAKPPEGRASPAPTSGPPSDVGAGLALPSATPAPVEKQAVLREAQRATRQVLAGNYRQGVAAFEQLLARLPPWEAARSSPDAYGFEKAEAYRAFLAAVNDNLGVAYLRAERFEQGAAAVSRAIALEPQSSKFHHNLGLCLYHARKYPEAVKALRHGASLPSPSPGIHYDLGRALAAAGNCGEAEAELSAALAELASPDPRGRDVEALYLRGGCRSDLGNNEPAEVDLREAVARAPGHQKALYKLAALLARRGDPAGAARARALFLDRQQNDEAAQFLKRSGQRNRDERLRLVEAYLAAGLAAQALQEAQTLLEANPRDPAALILLGEARLEQRPAALEAAAEAFGRALALAPGEPRARLGQGLAAARQQLAAGEAEAAVEPLRQQLEERPRHAPTLAALAEALLALPEARPHAAEALALLESVDRRYGRGEASRIAAWRLLGRDEEAQHALAESFFLSREERVRLGSAAP